MQTALAVADVAADPACLARAAVAAGNDIDCTPSQGSDGTFNALLHIASHNDDPPKAKNPVLRAVSPERSVEREPRSSHRSGRTRDAASPVYLITLRLRI